MGSACCKNLTVERPSPQLPLSEVVRRCARLICPVDPPQQKKSVYRPRKYNLSDIVGPVTKKESWAQTDPLPPPRRRRRRKREEDERMTRSAEFLPYLISQGLLPASLSAGSLTQLSGQEDVVDFQILSLDRLPRDSLDEGKEGIDEKKKKFLSALLSEENNNLVMSLADNLVETAKTEDAEKQRSTKEQLEFTTKEDERSTSSRRSSITESLREFENSLLEILDDEEEPPPLVHADEDQEEDFHVKDMLPLRRDELPTLIEEEEEMEPDETNDGNLNAKTDMREDVVFKSTKQTVYQLGSLKVTEVLPADLRGLPKSSLKEPPTITVEIVT